MIRKLLAATALSLAAAAPADAATFIVTHTGAVAIPPRAGNPEINEFKDELNLAGLFGLTSTGATLFLDGPGTITFEFLGSESGFSDKFRATNDSGGLLTKTETSSYENHFGALTTEGGATAPVLIGSLAYTGVGPINLAPYLKFTASSPGVTATVGLEGFGIFLPTIPAGAGSYSNGVLYLGYDDQPDPYDDDNHDDMIIRMTVSGVVPEPATWAMMIVGFGAVGASLRQARRKVLAPAVG